MTIDMFLESLTNIAPQFEWLIKPYSTKDFYRNHQLIRGKLKNSDETCYYCPINAAIRITKGVRGVTLHDNFANINASAYLNMPPTYSSAITTASDVVGVRDKLRKRILKAVGILMEHDT